MKTNLLKSIFILLILPCIAFGEISGWEPVFATQSVTPTLTGPDTVCAGTVGYIYATDPGMTNYVWSVTGGVITAGGTSTSNTVTVTWNMPGAAVSVTYAEASTTTTLDVTVLSAMPVIVTISADANPILGGIPVTFTAIPVNGGTSPVYQWTVNGSPAGANNPVFTYQPSDLDTVCCLLFSNMACATGNPAHSNCIIINKYGVGLEESPLNDKILVYPAPNDGRFKIFIATPTEETISVTVYNGIGSKLYELNEIKVNGVFEKDLDLRPLANGICSVVFSGKGIRTVCRMACINK